MTVKGPLRFTTETIVCFPSLLAVRDMNLQVAVEAEENNSRDEGECGFVDVMWMIFVFCICELISLCPCSSRISSAYLSAE